MKGVVSAGVLAGVFLALAIGGAGAAGPKATALCQTCHGVKGDSASGDVPRLNGQTFEYLKKRLDEFHDPGSRDPHATQAMWGIVEHTDDQTLADIARYYAAQAPTPAKVGMPHAEAGRKFYVAGDPANYIPGCASCHGANGEGRGDGARLAGQHPLYLKNELERMRLGLEASAVMHPKTNSITDEQIEALVAYLAGD